MIPSFTSVPDSRESIIERHISGRSACIIDLVSSYYCIEKQMSIPNFKSQHDWEGFTQIFDSQWHCKKALLNRVKDDLFPGYDWHSLSPKNIEVINDIVSDLVYKVEHQFKETHQDYNP